MRNLAFVTFSIAVGAVTSWGIAPRQLCSPVASQGTCLHLFGKRNSDITEEIPTTTATESTTSDTFEEFVEFLKSVQNEIIGQVEKMDGSGQKFSNDTWGVFNDDSEEAVLSGGITRVIQGGNVVEKGACSLTLIRRGILSAERATAIRSRQDLDIKAGDVYYAAALSIVFHSRSPLVPTFRSDVRIFLVQSDKSQVAWFG